MTQTRKHSLFQFKFASLKEHTNNSILTPTYPRQRTLAIPEILERILSFLPKRYRHVSARLVCMDWHAICMDLDPVSFKWHLLLTRMSEGDEMGALQDCISRADNIIIGVDNISLLSGSCAPRLPNWTRMMRVLPNAIHQHDLRRVHSRLRSIHIKEGVLESFAAQLHQLPQLLSLTTLKIEAVAKWDIVHLFTILRACPNLEELFIQRPLVAANKTTHGTLAFTAQPSLVLTSNDETAFITATNAFPTTTRLRTCVTHDMLVTLPAMGAFLQASAHLTKVVLAHCTLYARQGERLDTSPYRRSFDIFCCVRAHHSTLESFHISPKSDDIFGLREYEVESHLEAFPGLKEYSCTARDQMGSFLLYGLRPVVNRITTLNILPHEKESFRKNESISLQEILCSFEHLLHLRAPSMGYFVEDMDLNNMQGQFRNEWETMTDLTRHRHPPICSLTGGDVSRYIWTCRGLRTLHFTVNSVRSVELHTPETASIIFGFLSRMSPRLQELHMRRWRLDFSFQGGLCLLTRLQDLERLQIAANPEGKLTERDLFWMDPAPTLSTWNRIIYTVQRQLALRRRKMFQGVAPPEIEAARSKMIQRGRELGVDVSNNWYKQRSRSKVHF